MKQIILILSLCILMSQVAFASDYVLKETSLVFSTNPLLSGQDNKVSMMFPLLILAICLISVFIDFAAIGVTSASILILIAAFSIGLLPLSFTMIISMSVMALLFIWKLLA